MEMLAGIVLPHLSKNWEAGRRDEVGRQLVLGYKLCGLTVVGGSTAVLLAAPFVFEFGFGAKYTGGLEVLPWTLIYCSWFGMYLILQKYIWCAERIRLCILALGIGIAANVVLNLILLPRYGLLGAVLATAASKLLVVFLTALFNRMLGMHLDWRMGVVTLLPLGLALGGFVALAILALVGLAIIASGLILTDDEKRRLVEFAEPLRERLPVWLKA